MTCSDGLCPPLRNNDNNNNGGGTIERTGDAKDGMILENCAGATRRDDGCNTLEGARVVTQNDCPPQPAAGADAPAAKMRR